MRRRIPLALTCSSALLLVLGGWVFLRPSPPVTVTVENAGSKAIHTVRIEHELGIETLGSIVPGGSATAKFRSRAETSYRLHVRFADGSELDGNGEYAEPGYVFTETVTDTAIKTDLRLPGVY